MSRSWGISRAESWDRLKADPYKRTKFKYTPEEPEVSKVFVIINEWTDIAGDTSSELVGGSWFASEDEAWDALDLIAEAHGVDLGDEETSLQLEDHKSGLQSEEYRIEELTKG